MSNKIFNLHELPSAYFSDNNRSEILRKKLIKNMVNISTCNQSNLENIFFSDQNIDIINKLLILTIYNMSNKKYKIAEQSKEKLLIVMRYIFIEYAKHLPYNIKNQVLELNYLVINNIIPDIITNITQKLEYLKTIYCRNELLELPEKVKQKQILPSVTSIFDYDY